MHVALRVLLMCGLALIATAASAQTPSAKDRALLANLKKGHPRLMATDADMADIKKRAASDPALSRMIEDVVALADQVKDQPTVVHELIGPRLLSQSRAALNRIYLTGLAFRLTGDKSYARRAVKEMMAAAAFADWNPSHFLDTAEMTHALAIGYDWLYAYLLPEERAAVRRAIVELGLKPGAVVYNSGKGWPKARHNWNQVCNGGMIIGALAVADEEPDLAAWTLGRAIESLPAAMVSYRPDGGWPEGPGYWNYATRYAAYAVAALLSATGSDFGLTKFEGFGETGLFPLYMTSPIGQSFNFADGGSSAPDGPVLYWLANTFKMPVLNWFANSSQGRREHFSVLWYRKGEKTPSLAKLPLDKWFKRINVVSMRSSWADPDALFVGFKAGDNKENHSHLELGTFVLDSQGERFALELGSDDYNMPGYFGANRWSYYRLRTEGQNTLLIDGKNQDPKADAPIVAFSSEERIASAVADLTPAYAAVAQKVERGISLPGRKQVLIQDEITSEQPVDIVWGMHTMAQVQLQPDARQATLTRGGKTLTGRILEPEGAVFKVLSTEQAPPENPNKGILKLAVVLPQKTRQTTIRVLFTPGTEQLPVPEPVPLEKWPGRVR